MPREFRIALIVCLLMLSPIAVMSALSDEGHCSSKDRLIISYASDDAIPLLSDLARYYGSEIDVLPQLGIMCWEGWDWGIRKSIEKVDGVLSMDVERPASIMFTPDDSLYATYQWGAQRIKAPQAWDYTLGDKNITIAVLDTGIDYTHDDLLPNMWRDGLGHFGYDFWNGDSDPMDDNKDGYESGTWTPDLNIYHGTHIAGIAGAVTDNAAGIAGIAQVKLMAVKVMNSSGEGTDATVAEGITYAVDNGADIITMSLGVDSPTLALGKAVNYAAAHGIVMTAATGNDAAPSVSYPAAYPQVIAVGASDKLDHKASFSNYGSAVEIMAPGTQIWSTKPSDTYQELAGTSTATPFVAGVVALMLSVNPALTPGNVRDTLNSTAVDLGSAGWDSSTGWGLVDAAAAVSSVAGPAATIVNYSETAEPNETLTITWVVSGAGNRLIQETYLRWGYSPTAFDHQTAVSYGNTTPHTYSAANVRAPDNETGILYLRAFALINDTLYQSTVVEIEVQPSDVNPIIQFFNSLRDFIVDDLGILNFILIIVAIIAIAVVLAVVRGKRRATRRAEAEAAMPAQTAGSVAPPVPMAPPPIAAPAPQSASVEITAAGAVPATIEVIQGTRVIWRNRDWAPPPGISVISGYIDHMGPHPNGIFASGVMIAPGEYWSCVFNVQGTYNYYIANLNVNGRVVVRPM